MPSVETARPAQAPEDEDEPDEISWNLGFVEEPEKPHLLLRHRFPSKVGGRPAWLDPVRLPTREMLTCRASGRPLDFLLQIYAPVDANPVEGFHRALFLFISPEGSRLREPGAVRVFRCQLPRHNPYYSSEPAGVKDKYPPPLTPSDADASRDRDPWRSVDAERPPPSAAAGSTPLSSSSSSARKRRGGGGSAASTAAAELTETTPGGGSGGNGTTAAAPSPPSLPRTGVRGPGGLYPELELVVEPEDDYRDEDGEEWEEVQQPQQQQQQQQQLRTADGADVQRRAGGGGEAAAGAGGNGGGGGQPNAAAGTSGTRGGVEADVRRALQQYRTRVEEEGELDEEELPPDVLEAVEGAVGPEQRCFADFQARVSWAPEQVVRYCFQEGAGPLWPAPHGRPGPGDVPPCPRCGAPRRFEFQVLPQLLHYLRLDEEDPAAPDWSTLVAYCCAATCSVVPSSSSSSGGEDCAYTEEVVWVQPAMP